jgi:hypothetical protein
MLLKDQVGRRIYKSIDELAAELRLSSIVAVEVMEDEPTIVAVIVNPVDYVMGATAGGQVNLFDDFDIDYNQYKYLIETRLCGALTKLKSAIVVRRLAQQTCWLLRQTWMERNYYSYHSYSYRSYLQRWLELL